MNHRDREHLDELCVNGTAYHAVNGIVTPDIISGVGVRGDKGNLPVAHYRIVGRSRTPLVVGAENIALHCDTQEVGTIIMGITPSNGSVIQTS